MEFSSLKEQRSQQASSSAAAGDTAEAATTATASSQTESSSTSSSTRARVKRARKAKVEDSVDDSEEASSSRGAAAPFDAAASGTSTTPFGRAMADPDTHKAFDDAPNGSVAEDGNGAEIPTEQVTEQFDPEMKPHNLLRATELLQQLHEQQAGSSPMLSSFSPAPILRLQAIRITGASNTLRPSFLASLCRPYMDPALSAQDPRSSFLLNSLIYGQSRISHVLPNQPTTLPSILALTSSLASDLHKLDVFNGIEANLAPSLSPGANEEDVDIILNCARPKGRVFLKSSTDVGNGEGSASVQGRIRNVFGGAETLQGSATFGTRTKQAFNVELGGFLAMPFGLGGSVDNEYKVSVFALDRDLSAFASVNETIQGFRACVSTNRRTEPVGVIGGTPDTDLLPTSTRFQHEIAYEASLRSLTKLLPTASIEMRKLALGTNAGLPNVKSALSWTSFRDSRDNPALPTRGWYWKNMLEYAGLGGDANHVKVEVEAGTGKSFRLLDWLIPPPTAAVDSSSRYPSPSEKPSFPSAALDDQATDLSSDPASSSTPASTSILNSIWGHQINGTVNFRAGLLQSLSTSTTAGRRPGGGGGGSTTFFSDRFQLGGPTNVRMFSMNSLGPKSRFFAGSGAGWGGGDSLGGDMFWCLGCSLFSSIPGKPQWPLKLQTFFNAGQVDQLPLASSSPSSASTSTSLSSWWNQERKESLKSLLTQPSSSAGIGLVYLQDQLRVEFNVGVPLTARQGDGTRKGLQFGIGVQFL